MIKKVLMCQPTYFDVTYEINPWMKKGSVNIEAAKKQWQKLVDVYQNLGIEVAEIEPQKDYPDMVFATDQGISINGNFILSNFRFDQRRGESGFYENWLRKNGHIVKRINDEVFFEGGDAVMFGKKLILGHGFRTDQFAATKIEELLQIEVIPIKLIDDKFYHLDTALFTLNDKTLFYVPSAFEEKELSKLSQIAKLIPIDEREAMHFAANSLVTNGHVIMTPDNPKMKKEIEKQNYKVIEVDISEFLKSGGGLHCLTLVLD